jgi:hypothetical protein
MTRRLVRRPVKTCPASPPRSARYPWTLSPRTAVYVERSRRIERVGSASTKRSLADHPRDEGDLTPRRPGPVPGRCTRSSIGGSRGWIGGNNPDNPLNFVRSWQIARAPRRAGPVAPTRGLRAEARDVHPQAGWSDASSVWRLASQSSARWVSRSMTGTRRFLPLPRPGLWDGISTHTASDARVSTQAGCGFGQTTTPRGVRSGQPR